MHISLCSIPVLAACVAAYTYAHSRIHTHTHACTPHICTHSPQPVILRPRRQGWHKHAPHRRKEKKKSTYMRTQTRPRRQARTPSHARTFLFAPLGIFSAHFPRPSTNLLLFLDLRPQRRKVETKKTGSPRIPNCVRGASSPESRHCMAGDSVSLSHLTTAGKLILQADGPSFSEQHDLESAGQGGSCRPPAIPRSEPNSPSRIRASVSWGQNSWRGFSRGQTLVEEGSEWVAATADKHKLATEDDDAPRAVGDFNDTISSEKILSAHRQTLKDRSAACTDSKHAVTRLTFLETELERLDCLDCPPSYQPQETNMEGKLEGLPACC
jgi:hypothetical protein